MKNKVIIDIRDPFSFSIQSVPGSINVEASTLVVDYEKYLNKDTTYLLICDFGFYSEKVSKYLCSLGYDCHTVLGGFDKYNKR